MSTHQWDILWVWTCAGAMRGQRKKAVLRKSSWSSWTNGPQSPSTQQQVPAWRRQEDGRDDRWDLISHLALPRPRVRDPPPREVHRTGLCTPASLSHGLCLEPTWPSDTHAKTTACAQTHAPRGDPGANISRATSALRGPLQTFSSSELVPPLKVWITAPTSPGGVRTWSDYVGSTPVVAPDGRPCSFFGPHSFFPCMNAF